MPASVAPRVILVKGKLNSSMLTRYCNRYDPQQRKLSRDVARRTAVVGVSRRLYHAYFWSIMRAGSDNLKLTSTHKTYIYYSPLQLQCLLF